jgi:hypothetical protein
MTFTEEVHNHLQLLSGKFILLIDLIPFILNN